MNLLKCSIVVVLLSNLLFLRTATAGEFQVDVLYLKNGSIIKGNIVEVIPDSLLKIETSDGSLFVYNMSEVMRVGSERRQYKPQSGYRPTLDQDSHYKGMRSVAGWGLFYSWAATAIGSAVMGDDMFDTTIIPVVGPFATIQRIEDDPYTDYLPGGKGLLTLSGILQVGFTSLYVYALLNPRDTYDQFSIYPEMRDGISIIRCSILF